MKSISILLCMLLVGCNGTYSSGRYFPGYKAVARDNALGLEPASGKTTFLLARHTWPGLGYLLPDCDPAEGVLLTVDQDDIRVGQTLQVRDVFYYTEDSSPQRYYQILEVGTLGIEALASKNARRVAFSSSPRLPRLERVYSCRMGNPSLSIQAIRHSDMEAKRSGSTKKTKEK